jgi:hypothetical protein
LLASHTGRVGVRMAQVIAGLLLQAIHALPAQKGRVPGQSPSTRHSTQAPLIISHLVLPGVRMALHVACALLPHLTQAFSTHRG